MSSGLHILLQAFWRTNLLLVSTAAWPAYNIIPGFQLSYIIIYNKYIIILIKILKVMSLCLYFVWNKFLEQRPTLEIVVDHQVNKRKVSGNMEYGDSRKYHNFPSVWRLRAVRIADFRPTSSTGAMVFYPVTSNDVPRSLILFILMLPISCSSETSSYKSHTASHPRRRHSS
jgi:hypothetical protein